MPSDESWLAEDNIAMALRAYCPNTHFNIYSEKDIATKEPYWKGDIIRLSRFLRDKYPAEVEKNQQVPDGGSAVDLAIELLSRK